jgi:hypothetical protein
VDLHLVAGAQQVEQRLLLHGRERPSLANLVLKLASRQLENLSLSEA